VVAHIKEYRSLTKLSAFLDVGDEDTKAPIKSLLLTAQRFPPASCSRSDGLILQVCPQFRQTEHHNARLSTEAPNLQVRRLRGAADPLQLGGHRTTLNIIPCLSGAAPCTKLLCTASCALHEMHRVC
jgi:hypothetical protein